MMHAQRCLFPSAGYVASINAGYQRGGTRWRIGDAKLDVFAKAMRRISEKVEVTILIAGMLVRMWGCLCWPGRGSH